MIDDPPIPNSGPSTLFNQIKPNNHFSLMWNTNLTRAIVCCVWPRWPQGQEARTVEEEKTNPEAWIADFQIRSKLQSILN